jgi:hypothetical protein
LDANGPGYIELARDLQLWDVAPRGDQDTAPPTEPTVRVSPDHPTYAVKPVEGLTERRVIRYAFEVHTVYVSPEDAKKVDGNGPAYIQIARDLELRDVARLDFLDFHIRESAGQIADPAKPERVTFTYGGSLGGQPMTVRIYPSGDVRYHPADAELFLDKAQIQELAETVRKHKAAYPEDAGIDTPALHLLELILAR